MARSAWPRPATPSACLESIGDVESKDGHCEDRGCSMLDAAAESKPAAKGRPQTSVKLSFALKCLENL